LPTLPILDLRATFHLPAFLHASTNPAQPSKVNKKKGAPFCATLLLLLPADASPGQYVIRVTATE
jgi:hypothetical protein